MLKEVKMECAICYEICNEKEKLFKCSHVFHKSCINKWNGTCPSCRSERKYKTEIIYKLKTITYEKMAHIKLAKMCENHKEYIEYGQMQTPPYGGVIKCKLCGIIEFCNLLS
tara:strand:+ start:431 stop:766 length:336 start_codon:yes stop_codon:yes gene_type:complete